MEQLLRSVRLWHVFRVMHVPLLARWADYHDIIHPWQDDYFAAVRNVQNNQATSARYGLLTFTLALRSVA